jgi:outer membrane protein
MLRPLRRHDRTKERGDHEEPNSSEGSGERSCVRHGRGNGYRRWTDRPQGAHVLLLRPEVQREVRRQSGAISGQVRGIGNERLRLLQLIGIDNSGAVRLISLCRQEGKRYGRQKSVMTTTRLCRNCAFASLILNATVIFCVPFLSAQQPDAPLTLDAALVYARQHSPRLSAKRQGVTTEQDALAAARAERLPRLTLGAAARGSSQPTQTAMGFPLTQLADIPENQPFRRGHLNADVRATLPVYSGGRIGSAVGLAQAQRNLAQAGVHDLERSLDFDVTSAYANLVQLDRDIQAARESVNALTESRRVVAQMLNEGKVARVDLLKVDTRLADVQDEAIEFRNAREIETGQFNALLGRPIDTPVLAETALPPPAAQLSLDQVSQLARTGNTKNQIAQAEVSVSERSVAVAKSALRPSVSLAADLLGQSADPFAVYKGGVIAGAVFDFPFFDRTLTHRVEEAKSRELERRADLKQVELDAAQRARAAYLNMRNSEERIRATETAIAYAREALRIEQEKQRYGRGIIENLLDAQAALLTSEARYYRALADYTTAAAAVRRETGL